MRTRRLQRPAYDPALPTLRRRSGRLIENLEASSKAFVRLVPLLFEARFRGPALDTEPPGLVQPPRRRRWGKLCERIELPPPTSFSLRRPLIRSVLLSPRVGGRLELVVIALEGLSPTEHQRVAGRTNAIKQLALRHAPQLEVRLGSMLELTPATFAWAAVVAGDVPADRPLNVDAEVTHPAPPSNAVPEETDTWARGHETVSPFSSGSPTWKTEPLTDFEPRRAFDWHEAFAHAPTPLLRCLMLLVPRAAPAPLELLRSTQVPTTATGFLASWSESPVARDLLALDGKALSPAELDGLSRQFRLACLRALRSFPRSQRKSLRAALGNAVFGRKIAPVLRPHLERALRTLKLREIEVEHGWRLELEGLVIARARSLDQLRVLALSESPALKRPGPFWQRLSVAIEAHAPRALVLIEPGFLRHLIVCVPRSGRPHATRVDASGVLTFTLTSHRAGVPVELVPAPGCDPTLVARASQLLALPHKPEATVGLQLGNKVLLLEGARRRVLPLSRVLNRPRRLTWLPEQAEVSRALRPPLSTGLPTVQVVAFPESQTHAVLFALDAQGAIFRELVNRDELEATLQELREVLHHAPESIALSASVHTLLSSLAGRGAEPHPAVMMSVNVTPRGDQALFDGELFGYGAALSWSALGEAVLSHWAPGTSTHVGVNRVFAPPGTSGLTLIAARSRVLRRLQARLKQISRQLHAA